LKVLFVSTHFDPFHQAGGAQTRIRNLINFLNKENEVILLLPDRFSNEKFEVETRFFPEVHLFNRSSWYFSDLNIFLLKKVREIVKKEKVDLVHVSFPWGVISLSIVIGVPVVYDSHNVESQFMKIAVKSDDYPRITRFILPAFEKIQERLACKFCDHIISVSPVDMETYSRIYGTGKDKMTLIPIGVDPYKSGSKPKLKKKFGIGDGLAVVFHGTWDHKPNQGAFKEMERMSKLFGNGVKFVLAGTGTRRYRKGNLISLGEVEDIHELLSACDIAVVPLSEGSGMRVKILDYFAAGLPVVSTKKGIEGIEVSKEAIVVDSAEEMVSELKALIKDKKMRDSLGRAGKGLLEKRYSEKSVGNRISKLYKGIVNG
jgi:glycosyltransferase involved in cell wall biosynthesis